MTGAAPLLVYCLKLLLMNCSKFIITSRSMAGLSMCRAANCDSDARNRLGDGCLYTLFIMSDICIRVSSVKLWHSCSGNSPLNTAFTMILPSAAPLPSSPRMNPSGGVCSVICCPSYRHELEPVPSMHTIPSRLPHKAWHAAIMSLSTVIFAFSGNTFLSICTIMWVLSATHPAP